MTTQPAQLWPLKTVTEYLGLTTGSTRSWLSQHRISAIRRAPGNTAMYDSVRVRAARTEQLRKATARNRAGQHWVRWT